MESSDGGHWTGLLREEVEKAELSRLMDTQSTVDEENRAKVTEFSEKVMQVVKEVLGNTDGSKAREYALAAEKVLSEYRPALLDTAFEVQSDGSAKFRSWPGCPCAENFVQQVFYQAYWVGKAQEMLEEVRTATISTVAADILTSINSVLSELPSNLKLPVLFTPRYSDFSLCNLLSSTMYAILTHGILQLCEIDAFNSAKPFRTLANRLFSHRIKGEIRWGFDISPGLISIKAQKLYEDALNPPSIPSIQLALDYWYLIEPFGSHSYRLLAVLGDLYYEKKDETEAILAYRKAESILFLSESKPKESILLLLRLNRIQRKFSYPPAISVKSLEFALKVSETWDREMEVDVLYSLARAYTDNKQMELAELTFNSCLSLMESEGNRQLSAVYFHFGQQQFEYKRYLEAEVLLNKALTGASHSVEDLSKDEIYQKLIDLYTQWKPEWVERTQLLALIEAMGKKVNEGRWCEQLMERYRCKRRDKEEQVAVLVMQRCQGGESYRKYAAFRAIRALYH